MSSRKRKLPTLRTICIECGKIVSEPSAFCKYSGVLEQVHLKCAFKDKDDAPIFKDKECNERLYRCIECGEIVSEPSAFCTYSGVFQKVHLQCALKDDVPIFKDEEGKERYYSNRFSCGDYVRVTHVNGDTKHEWCNMKWQVDELEKKRDGTIEYYWCTSSYEDDIPGCPSAMFEPEALELWK